MFSPILRITIAAVGLWLVWSAPVEAHKLKVFATAVGAAIDGYAYFSTGGRAQQASVTVTAPDGTVILQTSVDSDGNFHIPVKQRVDHRITVDGGDGHVASYTVTAADLPESLPTPSGMPTASAPAPAKSMPAPAAPAEASGSGLSEAALLAAIDKGIARQIRPLREEVDAYQEKIWWHDVLGGIGYILGLGGLAYGLTERRRRREPLSPFARRHIAG